MTPGFWPRMTAYILIIVAVYSTVGPMPDGDSLWQHVVWHTLAVMGVWWIGDAFVEWVWSKRKPEPEPAPLLTPEERRRWEADE